MTLGHPVVERPYRDDDLPTYEQFSRLPTRWVHVGDLHPTQPVLIIDRVTALAAGQPPEGEDPCVHLVRDTDGRLLIHNGHHRWAVALLSWTNLLPARIHQLPAQQEEAA